MWERKIKERELLEDFIRAYENQPCLWRIKSPEYHDRPKKKAAYNILLEKYRLIDSEADKDAVLKKLNVLRTCYRREKRKVESSHCSGGDLYVPTLWYYHLFDFLADQEAPGTSTSYLNDTDRDTETEETQSNPVPDPPKKRKTLPLPKDENLFEMACDISKESHDDSEIQAKAWSLQYNQLSHQQKVFARKIISDVFYNGVLGRLDESTVRDIQSVLDGSNQLSSD